MLRMNVIQNILVYLTLAIAVAYLVRKFLLPKKRLASGKDHPGACGKNDCGCH